MAKSKKSQTKKSKSTKNTKQDLLYIMSNACGWCKKAQPVVDELIKEGAKITILDVQNPDDQKRINEVKQKHNAQCGTPFYIDDETGNQICGHREKDVLQKWVNGEEIPQPPKPKGPPPPPPQDFENKGQVAGWTTKYEEWVKENDHMPNLPTSEQMLQRLKQQKQMMEQRQAQQGAGGPLEGRISVIEQKLDRLLKHLGVNTAGIQPPTPPQGQSGPPRPPVPPTQPRRVPAPPASKKPPKKKRAKGGK